MKHTIKVIKPDGTFEQFESTRDYKYAIAVKCKPGHYWYDEYGHLWHIVKHTTKKSIAEKEVRTWRNRDMFDAVVILNVE